jgi:hypothetical protein
MRVLRIRHDEGPSKFSLELERPSRGEAKCRGLLKIASLAPSRREELRGDVIVAVAA